MMSSAAVRRNLLTGGVFVRKIIPSAAVVVQAVQGIKASAFHLTVYGGQAARGPIPVN